MGCESASHNGAVSRVATAVHCAIEANQIGSAHSKCRICPSLMVVFRVLHSKELREFVGKSVLRHKRVQSGTPRLVRLEMSRRLR